MKEPKTIKGYISMMKKIELMIPSCMNGFDDLPKDIQDDLNELSAAISNRINEIPIPKTK